MAFTVQHYSDLVQLLTRHPEWRQELRRLLFSEFEGLLEVVQALAEAQHRTEKGLQGVEAAVGRLAEAQHRTEERLERLEAAVERLTGVLAKHTDIIGDLRGRMLELDYERKAAAYFGPMLRRVRVYRHDALADALELHLSPGELRDALLVDLVVQGAHRDHPELPEVLLAVEISGVVDREDVNRARRRAMLLQQAGYPVIPVVAGEKVARGAEDEIQYHNVVLLQDSRISLWQEALEVLSASKTES